MQQEQQALQMECMAQRRQVENLQEQLQHMQQLQQLPMQQPQSQFNQPPHMVQPGMHNDMLQPQQQVGGAMLPTQSAMLTTQMHPPHVPGFVQPQEQHMQNMQQPHPQFNQQLPTQQIPPMVPPQIHPPQVPGFVQPQLGQMPPMAQQPPSLTPPRPDEHEYDLVTLTPHGYEVRHVDG